MTKKSHGGKRKGAGRKATVPEREKKTPLVLSVKQKTKQKIVTDYGLKGFAELIDDAMEDKTDGK